MVHGSNLQIYNQERVDSPKTETCVVITNQINRDALIYDNLKQTKTTDTRISSSFWKKPRSLFTPKEADMKKAFWWTRWWIVAAGGRWFEMFTWPHRPRSSRPSRLQKPGRSHTAGRPGHRRTCGADADCWGSPCRHTEECVTVCPALLMSSY